jgi:NAD(P)-dependent dehydrogenase (short-subunit alcohol dehydrogenase family)
MRHAGVDAPIAQARSDNGFDDALRCAGCLEVDACDARMRVLAAYERNVQLARQLQVVDETGLSPQQARVLEPPHSGPDERHHASVCSAAHSMRPFEGKVALVTGAASGIGRVTALAFACDGARVVVSDIDAAGGAETVRLIRAAEGEAEFVRADVSDERQVQDMVDGCIDAFGRLDFAHNNAGIGAPPTPLHETELASFSRVIGVNLVGVWLCLKHEARVMLAQGGGAIVNTASLAGLIGFPMNVAYSASKHAVIGITRTAALEYAQSGVRVNAVCPAFIHTPMVEGFAAVAGPRMSLERLARMQPMGRIGTPEEVAQAVVWLCSESAAFITGIALPIDGGTTAR